MLLTASLSCNQALINADISRAAEPHGLMYAPDPASFEISSVGGNLATNAGGLRCVRYGVTRDSVTGLRVVLPSGSERCSWLRPYEAVRWLGGHSGDHRGGHSSSSSTVSATGDRAGYFQ